MAAKATHAQQQLQHGAAAAPMYPPQAIHHLSHSSSSASIAHEPVIPIAYAPPLPSVLPVAPPNGNSVFSHALGAVPSPPSAASPSPILSASSATAASASASETHNKASQMEAQWRALKTMKWYHGKELTAFIQDLALQHGTRALVATSGGSYKKFVCSSETPCSWLINAVCSRPRKRMRPAEDSNGNEPRQANSTAEDDGRRGRYWYITSGTLQHDAQCSSTAKPTARQLKNSMLLQSAVQNDARVSSAVLVERLKAQEKLVCSKSMVYKAKTDLLDELTKSEQLQQQNGESSNAAVSSSTQDHTTTQCLPSYLAQMSALNPHVMSVVERDGESCFSRAMLAMDPTGVWNDQSVLGIDSVEVQHPSAYNGTELLLVGRDGNLNPIIHAIALVPEETQEHWTWFLDKMIAHGFPLRRFPLYTNGRYAVSASCATLQIPHVMHCTQHLVHALAQNDGIALTDQQEPFVWQAQQAETENEYFMALHQLSQGNAAAAQYVKQLDPKRWALFPYVTLRKLYGWHTTLLAQVDHGQNMGLAPHSQSPYEFFKAMTLVLMNGTFQRHERAVAWERAHRVVTPEAERMMQDELARVHMYNVVMSTPHLAFVWNANEPQIRQRRVDLQHRTCTCAFRMQWGIPCRHMLAALHKVLPFQPSSHNGLHPASHQIHPSQCYEFFDECYLVRNYISSFKGRYLELPLEESIVRDPSLRPARLVPKASTPTSSSRSSGQGDHDNDNRPNAERPVNKQKKRRVRTRPLQDRKRGIYKCHKCHRAEGHNKGTCPYQQVPQLQQQQLQGAT
uniref:SWIM-type domain-containing protein n=1 Tax=Globisporangium ultimum (strain ATCC 200006 / CBS 805.95 / DAOM BR144) TaxID=431595 RepID=K3WFV6_GLOUD